MTMKLNLLPEKVLFYGALLLFLVCVVIFLSSCSLTRKVNKDIEKTHSTEISNEKTTTNTHANTNTRTTEGFDSCVNIPGSKTSSMGSLFNLQKGDTLKTENNDVSASVYIDGNGNIGVTANEKPKIIPIKGQRITETNEIKAVEEQKQSSDTKVQDDLKKHVTSDTKATNNLPWLFLLLIPIAGLIYVFRKQIPYLKNFC